MNKPAILSLLFNLTFIHLIFAENFEYKTYSTDQPKQFIHHFKVNPKRLKIELINGTDSCLGLETVSSIAKRHNAILAVNGGYFQGVPLLGVPDGPFKINNLICGYKSGECGALGWNQRGKTAHIDRVKMKVALHAYGRTLPVDAINRKLHPGHAVIYTSNFNRTTMTLHGTKEHLIKNHIFHYLLDKNGNHTIPEDGFIYAIDAASKLLIPAFLNQRQAMIHTQIDPVLNPDRRQQWQSFDNIVNGVLILSNGTLIKDYEKENVSTVITKQKHARTAIGIDSQNWWHIVIVEAHHQGRIGMTMDELGILMQHIGCRFAICLDGGGSSSFSYQGKTHQFIGHKNHSFMQNNVYYHPDGGERPVGNAIIVKAK
ncbi:MAG: phosphodiester glycosidase family protein [Simkaniaceae bacterium]|nr:phosphodiester glycosidase family protein [Simkaniaceae bacterium]MCF7852294.1 phosphodiester glycosidase family protein [Simkaniaceae bacterium]